MQGSSPFEEWPIEKVTVVCGNDSRARHLNMFKEPSDQRIFVRFVENGKGTFEFRLGGKLKVINIFRYYFTIGNEKALGELFDTCASIMYEIIIIESIATSGNLSGSFVVSISKASTTGSARVFKSSLICSFGSPWIAFTSYHIPTRKSMLAYSTEIDSDSCVICYVVLTKFDNVVRWVILIDF
jgi:hypothetical protein